MPGVRTGPYQLREVNWKKTYKKRSCRSEYADRTVALITHGSRTPTAEYGSKRIMYGASAGEFALEPL